MSDNPYKYVLELLNIEDSLLTTEYSYLNELIESLNKSCPIHRESTMYFNANIRLFKSEIYDLRKFQESVKNSAWCLACSKSLKLRCERFRKTKELFINVLQQFMHEAEIEQQCTREKMRLVADAKERLEDNDRGR